MLLSHHFRNPNGLVQEWRARFNRRYSAVAFNCFAFPAMTFPDATTITATGAALAAVITAITKLIAVIRGNQKDGDK